MAGTVKKLSVSGVADMLRGADDILIISHARPDGDTLGSAIALETALRRMGKRAYVVCDDKIPESIAFITEFRVTAPLETDLQKSLSPSSLPNNFAPGLVVTADVASLGLAGAFGESYAGRIDLKIDHHEMGESFASHELIYPGCASCAEVIFDIISELDMLDRISARAIYTGMVTDSGSFRFSSVTAETHERAAEILRLGINHDEISEKLFNSKTKAEHAATALALNNLRFFSDDKIALTTLSRMEMDERGISRGDTESINTIPIGTRGVMIGIVIKEDDAPGFYKISVRSGAEFAANSICALLGGGGHSRAAGAKYEARDMSDAIRIALDAVRDITELDISL